MSVFSDASQATKLSLILALCQQREAGTAFVQPTSGPAAAGYASIGEIAKHFNALESEIETLVNVLAARSQLMDSEGLTFASGATTAGARRFAYWAAE